MEPSVVLALLSGIGFLWLMWRTRRERRCRRDPQRTFNAHQRRAGFTRAGNQCEQVSTFGRRCRSAPSHGDHIHPWSRGGATTMSNFAALCGPHNLAKSNMIPTPWGVWRLQRRRLRYFPADQPVRVVWQIGAPPPPRRRASPTGHNTTGESQGVHTHRTGTR